MKHKRNWLLLLLLLLLLLGTALYFPLTSEQPGVIAENPDDYWYTIVIPGTPLITNEPVIYRHGSRGSVFIDFEVTPPGDNNGPDEGDDPSPTPPTENTELRLRITGEDAGLVLELPFGTVFPGTQFTGDFTVNWNSGDLINYAVILKAPADTTLTDMRPFIVVQKNPAESDTETDGVANGATGDYSADGHVQNSTDPADNWQITFTAPDIEGDYGCQIEISTED